MSKLPILLLMALLALPVAADPERSERILTHEYAGAAEARQEAGRMGGEVRVLLQDFPDAPGDPVLVSRAVSLDGETVVSLDGAGLVNVVVPGARPGDVLVARRSQLAGLARLAGKAEADATELRDGTVWLVSRPRPQPLAGETR